MTQEQARQEAEIRVWDYLRVTKNKPIQCAIISINREIELCKYFIKSLSNNEHIVCFINDELNDLNQIKDELLKK
jgi:hypothetical protein